MKHTLAQLDWGLFLSFHASDAPEFQSDSNVHTIDRKTTGYDWGPPTGDVSLFSLDGFSISSASTLVFGFKLQPRLDTVSVNGEHVRQSVGRLRWFNVEIETSSLEYEIPSDVNPGLPERRRASVYYTGPLIVAEGSTINRKTKTIEVLDKQGEVEIEYEAVRYFDPEEGADVGQILVLRAILVIKSPDILHQVITKNGHRITCLIQTMDRNENRQVQLNKLYLGRAQEVTTRIESNTRKLIWTSDPNYIDNDDHFPGMTPRSPKQRHWEQHREESSDLQLIQMLDAASQKIHARGDLSARHSIAFGHHFIPDHDDYKNPTHKLPVYFCSRHKMTLKFFNFKFTPPRCVEVSLKWHDFEAAEKRELMSPRNRTIDVSHAQGAQKNIFKRMKKLFKRSSKSKVTQVEQMTLEKPLREGITLRVYFHEDQPNERMKLDSIEFIATDYERTLDMVASKCITI